MCTKVTREDYQQACDDSMGFCTVCKSFTRECTEPDAEDYDCDCCGEETSVVGAENALIMNLIELE